MQAIRSRDTKPELAIRRLLHASGLRYRVDVRPEPEIPRRADVVFSRARVAVFVDGCFWHGCPEHGRREHRVNAWYWPEKIQRNVDRDADTTRRLIDRGWTVIRIWEHEPAADAAARVSAAVRRGERRPGSSRSS